MNIENRNQLMAMLRRRPVINPVSSKLYMTAEDGRQLVGVSSTDITRTHIQPHGRAQKYLNQFLEGQGESKWLLMPGLRGVGKTTILKQLYHANNLEQTAKFYLSLDQVKALASGLNMSDVIAALESILQSALEDYDKSIVLLLDEVQYLDDWALGLKTIFDRCRRIFIVATGSSAIALQTSPDVARRVDILRVHPLNFADFNSLRRVYDTAPAKRPPVGLEENLRSALLSSTDAQQLMATLEELSPQVKSYWKGLDRTTLLSQYRQYGSLPYVLNLEEEAERSHRINQTLNTILLKDLAADSRSSAKTLANMPKLLLLLAHAERRGMATLSKILNVNLATVQDMIRQLEQAEIIQAVKPWKAKSGRLTKPYRYLFSAPAIRLALVDSAGRLDIDDAIRDLVRGLLWEDVVGLYLRRMLDHTWQPIIEYDTAPGGADFIVSPTGGDAIIIEVGSRKTSSRQVVKTQHKVDSRYGLIVTDDNLRLDQDNKTIYLPFEFFLLA